MYLQKHLSLSSFCLSLSSSVFLSPGSNKRGHVTNRARALTSLEILYPGQERPSLCPMWRVTCLVVCWLLSPYSAFLINEKYKKKEKKSAEHTTTTSTVTNCLLTLSCFRLAQGVVRLSYDNYIYANTAWFFILSLWFRNCHICHVSN